MIDDPRIAPMVPPTPMRAKRRRLWRSLYRSVMNDQKTDTTKRLKTLVQTKNDRPAQISAWPPSGNAFRTRKNTIRQSMKKR